MLKPLLFLQLQAQRARWWTLPLYGTLLPSLLYLLSIRGDGASYTRSSIYGVLVYSSVFVVFRPMAQFFVSDRLGGVIALLRSCAVTRRHYLGARFIEACCLAIFPCLSLAGIALVAGQAYALHAMAIIAYALWIAVLYALACLFASLLSPSICYQITNLFSIVLCTVSPLFYPMDRVPAAIATPVAMLPSTLMMEAMTGTHPGMASVGLTAWLGLLLPVAWLGFRWDRA